MTRRERSPHRGFIGIVAMAICAIVLAYGIVVAAVRVVVGPDPCRDQIPPRDEELYEAPASPPGGGAVGLSLGPTTSCAAMRDGATYCWGDVVGTLSIDGRVSSERRPRAGRARLRCGAEKCDGSTITIGENGNCVRSLEGKVLCEPAGQAAPFPGVTLDAVGSVSIGATGACAIREGRLWCWDHDGTAPGAPVGRLPTEVDGAPPDLKAVALGGGILCVLTRAGGVACAARGRGRYVFLPIDVGPAKRVTAGAHHACAVTRDGHVKCWGSNSSGELGDGSEEARQSPSTVVGIVERVTEIDAAESRTCVATEAGHVYCWGGVGACVRRCDDRSVIAVPTPQQVPIEEAVEVRLGRDHACARKRDGTVACWGDNRRHQVSAFVPFDDYGYSIDRCDVTRRLDLPGSDYPVAVRW